MDEENKTLTDFIQCLILGAIAGIVLGWLFRI